MKPKHGLLAILVLAGVLRCILIGSRSINYDDAFSFFLSQQSLQKIVSGTAADTMPPLYYFLLHFWMSVSEGLGWLRLLSVLLSLGMVWLTYLWVKEAVSIKAGLWAALFTAVSPFHIYHAQDLRMYALLGFCQVAYLVLFTRIWKAAPGSKNSLAWVGLILAGTAAMYSHNLAIFGLVTVDLFLLFKRAWKQLGRLLLAQLIIGVLSIPWLLMVPGQLQKIQTAFWTPRPGLTEIVQAVLTFTIHLPLNGGWMIFGLTASVLALIFTVYINWKSGRKNDGLQLLASVGLLLPAMLFVISYIIRPVFVPRGFILSSMAYYGLIGAAVTRTWRTGMGKLLAFVLLAAVLVTLPFFYSFESFPRSPFRQAAAYLKAGVKNDDVILHDNKLSYFPMHFFERDLSQKFMPDTPGSINDTYAPASQQAMGLYPQQDLEQATSGARSIYFVTFTETVSEYQSLGQAQHPTIGWLGDRYHLAEKTIFGDLEIHHYLENGNAP